MQQLAQDARMKREARTFAGASDYRKKSKFRAGRALYLAGYLAQQRPKYVIPTASC
jgi:hypothetical protein